MHPLWKTIWWVLKILKIDLIIHNLIVTFGYMHVKFKSRKSKIYLSSHVHSSIIHKCQKTEITQVCVNRWLNRQNVIHTYNGMLLSNQREWCFVHATMRDVGLILVLGRFAGIGSGNPSGILPWEIPGTEEPSELQSLGSQRAGNDWAHTHTQQEGPWKHANGNKPELEEKLFMIPLIWSI